MHTIIFDRRDISLEYENQCLIIRQKDAPPRSIPLSRIGKVICMHSVQLTGSLLGQLYERGIDFVHLNNRHSERSFSLIADQQKQVQRRCMQYHWQFSEQFCLSIAQKICAHRLKNGFRVAGERMPIWLRKALSTAEVKVYHSKNLQELRGIEGAAQRLLFEYWRTTLPDGLNFKERRRRPPPDPVNALLSLSYTIAMQESIRQCKAAGLDSQLGFYHRIISGRHSLACDLMEVSRPYCEAWVMQLFHKRLLDKRHFTIPSKQGDACLLGKKGREVYYHHLEHQMKVWSRQLKASAHWLCKEIDTGLEDAL